jgi:hypothetical protein
LKRARVDLIDMARFHHGPAIIRGQRATPVAVSASNSRGGFFTSAISRSWRKCLKVAIEPK